MTTRDHTTAARLNCSSCGARDVTETHIGRCQIVYTARAEAEAHGAAQGIPAVTTADLWAHLGHVASPQDATRIVRQVVDLGWRPVVGKDPARKWTDGADLRRRRGIETETETDEGNDDE